MIPATENLIWYFRTVKRKHHETGRKISEQDAWRLLRDVASGLAWLHAMNPPVIHQDIKPDNIMVADNGDL